ncbi:MAG: hypothetical protein V3V40_06120 [Nitrosomonadaceae bacterium]
MDTSRSIIEREHSERGHDPGKCCEDDNASLEYQAQAMAETYMVILYSEGEVVVGGKAHTWQEVLDEDLDNILELQRALHTARPSMSFSDSAVHFAEAAVALKAAQNTVVNDWAIRTARERVGL